MRIKFAIIFMFAATLFITFFFCSCSGDSVTNTVFLYGLHNNGFKPDSITLKKEIESAYVNLGDTSYVIVDGKPTVIRNENGDPIGFESNENYINRISAKSNGGDYWMSLVNTYANNVYKELEPVEPKEPEVDTLEALFIAAQQFNSFRQTGISKIVIFDSGICTTGYLNFKGIDLDNTTEIVNNLKNTQNLPKLDNINIQWYNVGVASGEQYVDRQMQNKIKNLWQQIIKASGGKCRFTDVNSGDALVNRTDYPKVTTIELVPQNIEPTLIKPTPSNITNTIENGEVIFNFKFVSGTATFINIDEADKELLKTSKYMTEHADLNWLVVGCTATDELDYCIQLSRERADAIKRLLLSNGVNPSRLRVFGLGFKDPWHISDLNSEGELIEPEAQENRKVVVIESSKEKAIQIINDMSSYEVK